MFSFLLSPSHSFSLSLPLNMANTLSKALSHPIDMMYHLQPWMLFGLFPLAFIFEVLPALKIFIISANHEHASSLSTITTATLQQHSSTLLLHSPVDSSLLIKDDYSFDAVNFWPIVHLILIGSILAFLMEFSEYLLLTYTSSLTLSIAGIFKEIFTLYLAVNYNGDQMSLINFIGLIVCLVGITTHVLLKTINFCPGKFFNFKLAQKIQNNFKIF